MSVASDDVRNRRSCETCRSREIKLLRIGHGEIILIVVEEGVLRVDREAQILVPLVGDAKSYGLEIKWIRFYIRVWVPLL